MAIERKPRESARPARASGRPAHDVIILGTGPAGSMLGSILVERGVRVLLIDRSQHPRFAIGESTIPQTSMMARILAARFQVPEIARIGGIRDLVTHVTSSCGVKRNFGFVYHREGEAHRVREANQTLIPEFLHGPESHLFRQDTDAWMLMQALHRGADVCQGVDVVDVEIDGSGVSVIDSRGQERRARYLVDASGFASPVVKKFGLRAEPCDLATHSRSLFTHMVDVRPFEDCVEPRGVHRMPRLWSQGTLHHLFDGGWLWVIPFNNRDGATNPLISVGFMLDPRRFPPTGQPPAEEFAAMVERFPSIARQFAGARSFRNWVSTGRIQYRTTTSVGDRYCLMSHAAGFVDALFSRGLANTTELVQQLGVDLPAALAEDDLSAERFARAERLQQSLIAVNDRLVANSFTAFRDFRLWNAWHRVWVVGAFLGWLRLTRVHKAWEETGASPFPDPADLPVPGSLCPGLPAFDELFDSAAREVEAVEAGQKKPAAAAAAIMEQIRESAVVPPPLALGEEKRLHTPVLGQAEILGLYQWMRRSAPPEINGWFKGTPTRLPATA